MRASEYIPYSAKYVQCLAEQVYSRKVVLAIATRGRVADGKRRV